MLANKPSDPSKIRFDDDCFVVVAEKPYWLLAKFPYPERTENADYAESAQRKGREVSAHIETARKRIKWL